MHDLGGLVPRLVRWRTHLGEGEGSIRLWGMTCLRRTD